jgi:hypothetical protein
VVAVAILAAVRAIAAVVAGAVAFPAASAFWRRRCDGGLADAMPTAGQDLEPLAGDRSAALSESHELAPVSKKLR